MQFGVIRVVVRNDWVVAGPIVSNEEGPPPAVTSVLVGTMEDITMEEDSITRIHLYFNQRQHLQGDTANACEQQTTSTLNSLSTHALPSPCLLHADYPLACGQFSPTCENLSVPVHKCVCFVGYIFSGSMH